jgi:hypothetical protein
MAGELSAHAHLSAGISFRLARADDFLVASGIGRLDPRQMVQPRPKGFVGSDQIDVCRFGNRDVNHVVDWMIVVSPRQFPGPVDMAQSLEMLSSRQTMGKLRLAP